MTLTKTDICALLPHTGSMCVLDAVLRWDADEIVCTARSHRDPANPLRRGDMLPAVAAIEYAAQAMGVHGQLASRATDKPKAGYLASLRDVSLAAERLDTIQSDLSIRARRLADSAGSVMCEFDVSGDGRSLVSGRATLLLEVR